MVNRKMKECLMFGQIFQRREMRKQLFQRNKILTFRAYLDEWVENPIGFVDWTSKFSQIQAYKRGYALIHNYLGLVLACAGPNPIGGGRKEKQAHSKTNP